MSFIKKIFGLDNTAMKESARTQAEQLRQNAEATKRQSMAIADQSATQTRLAQERSKVEEQVRLMQEASQEGEAEVDIGEAGEATPGVRRRRAYQNPNAGAAGAIRI